MYTNNEYRTNASQKPAAEADVFRAFVGVLARRLTPEQMASALEEWEMICEENGWPVPRR